ncbi:DUF6233 domain-containing protein [Streptomyces sp. Isolate_45]|nr:DUF6233 domain-containing protein [Streptomyces sp. Isolate_45]MDA5286302.1 DUF6233 domain-containing protein [Streptomyces sp. Isolate_45]
MQYVRACSTQRLRPPPPRCSGSRTPPPRCHRACTGDCWDTRTRCEAATTDAAREALAEGIPACPRCRPHTPRSASSTATATYPEKGGRPGERPRPQPGGHLLLPHCTGAHHHHVSGFHTSGPAPSHVVRCRGCCSHRNLRLGNRHGGGS